MAVKRDKYDIIFSSLVRERADYQCEHCRRTCRHEPGYLDCAHIHSRKHRATRWHKSGAVALCKPCHSRFTDFPLEWAAFVRELYGDVLADEIQLLANSVRKWTKAEKEEMYQHYKSELKRIQKERSEGARGWIDFEGWD